MSCFKYCMHFAPEASAIAMHDTVGTLCRLPLNISG